MRRSGPLRRSPLARSTSTLTRYCTIPAVSARTAAANVVRRAAVARLKARAEGCARCGRRDVPVHGHERLGRSQGGDPTRPDCLLCVVCNEWCESSPQTAAYTGWKVSRKYGHADVLTDGQALALDGTIVTFGAAP